LPDDLEALEALPSVRRATDAAVVAGSRMVLDESSGAESERLLGTVVHRLMQALGTTGGSGDVAAMALQLLRPDETAGLADRDGFAARAASAYAALCNHPDVRSLYSAADILHEVPFVVRLDGQGTCVRGTIDCLVHAGPADVTVLEFKTGRPRPEHAGQLELYASVASQLFPGSRVTQKLIYTELGALP
jgi:ATP-dependent exoDNAse (exonuclease V) beta subunit